MASLNLSANGPSISKSYQSIISAPPPSGPAASSSTYGQWAVFAVSAPLASAFQQDSGNKESVLKVQSTGEGELVDLVEEFSDGRIQFAYVKIKDSNTGLPKYALIGWCGEGVPERTKGYFGSHLAAVSKLLHGYHVQITARSDRDLTPDSIVQKIAAASGSKYSAGGPPPPVAATKPNVAAKPAFTPTQSQSSGGFGYSPSGISRPVQRRDQNLDHDGWGEDAPPVTRTQLEKVAPAYQPTKINMRELSSQDQSQSSGRSANLDADRPGVIGGSYQPVGRVDIAALRQQAREPGNVIDDRPTTVKGAYEPVGKVDIAAIRAKAQKPSEAPGIDSARNNTTEPSSDSPEPSRSLAQRSAAFSGPERLTEMPKPRVANRFGGSSFTGTKAPLPGGFEAKPVTTTAPGGLASRTFADEGGKTPAQIWAEKKARARGPSGSGEALSSGYSGQPPIKAQTSGDGAWKSGYAGKSWAPVQTTHTGQSVTSDASQERNLDTEQVKEAEEDAGATSGGIGALRDRFSGAAPMGAPSAGFDRPAPEPDTSNKPNRGIPIPGLASQPSMETQRVPTPPQQPRSPTPPTPEARDTSPIRVAMPVGRGDITDAREEQMSPPPVMPVRSITQSMPTADDDDEPDAGPDPARAVAQTTAAAAAPSASHQAPASDTARAEYDYEAAEDNEVSLREGEIVTNVEKVDPDWWVVTNEHGQSGLVPSNYLKPIGDDDAGQDDSATAPAASHISAPAQTVEAHAPAGLEADALYEYEAAGKQSPFLLSPTKHL